jgi:lipopolysaccharide biosynthesis glycosyltransferase
MTSDYMIFIGSGESSKIEKGVLIWSLVNNGNIPKNKICVFNGTHDTLENSEGEVIKKLDMDLFLKYKNITEFSLYRFLIPELMNNSGYGIWLDSDVLCLNSNISEFIDFHINNPGYDLACVANAYPHLAPNLPALSVVNINCSTTRFDLLKFKELMIRKKLKYNDISALTENFCSIFPLKIADISVNYNSFDYICDKTCLVHYTDLHRQPWKFHWHPYGAPWHAALMKAVESGYISDDDVKLTISRGYVRADLLHGNIPSFRTIASMINKMIRYIIR